MQVNYQKDINHNYMTIQAEREIDMDSYPIRMLLGNEIASLVPCRIQAVDGGRVFCYDIGSRETAETCFMKKKLGRETIRFLMQGIIQVIQDMQAFLLDVNQLVIQPEMLYYDKEKNGLQFCYFPGYDHQIQEQIRNFLEQILPLIDHGEPGAVAMGYGMYQKATEKSFQLEQLKEYLYKEEEEQTQRTVKVELMEEEPKVEQEEMTEDEKVPWDTLIFSFIWTVVLLGICCLRFLGYLDFLTVPMILGIFIFVMSAVCINAFLWKKHNKKSSSGGKGWTESSALQASIQWPGKNEVDTGQVQKIYQEEQQEQKTVQTEETEADCHTLSLDDTQPLPTIKLPVNARLISKEAEKRPDIELTGDLTVIGKTKEVDVQILLPTVSRVHAKVWRDEEQYYIKDLNSKNGTFVNGSQISGKNNCRIVPGDEVYFADAGYTFRV